MITDTIHLVKEEASLAAGKLRSRHPKDKPYMKVKAPNPTGRIPESPQPKCSPAAFTSCEVATYSFEAQIFPPVRI